MHEAAQVGGKLQLRDIAALPDRDTGSNGGSTQMIIKLSARERATILAALRRWLSYPAAREADAIATNRGKHKPLDDGEIQRLCKRITEINRRGDAGPSRRQLNNGARVQKQLRDDQPDPRDRPATRASGYSTGVVQYADNCPLRARLGAILRVRDRIADRVGSCIPDRTVSKQIAD